MNAPSPLLARHALMLVLLLLCVAAALALWHSQTGMTGHLIMFDEDLSDSFIGWVIAIPIVVVALVVAVLALLFALVLTVFLVVVALALALFGILVGLAPVVAFFAIPVLAVVGLVKLVERKRSAPAAS